MGATFVVIELLLARGNRRKERETCATCFYVKGYGATREHTSVSPHLFTRYYLHKEVGVPLPPDTLAPIHREGDVRIAAI